MTRVLARLATVLVVLALPPLLPGMAGLRAQAPSTHRAPTFLSSHGATARENATTCQVCHQQESCLVCHRGTPQVAVGFPPGASGQAMGVQLQRRRPPSHTASWTEAHQASASARPETCAGCHVRADCLECHRAGADRASGYHPPGFLTTHPAQAYSRRVSCSDCHNTGQFCASCHQQAGLVARQRLLGGYHDAKQAFLGGHGQAARQSLESCVSCHVENDCLTCHRQFKPHGPGFDGQRLREKNPDMCSVCHGSAIPGSPSAARPPLPR